ncbi:MAG: hypothetical protein U0900_17890 [Myxococcota bacterium]
MTIVDTDFAALWRTTRVTTLTASSQRLGFFEITGNLGGGTPTARITYLPEPDSSSALPAAAGLLALVGLGRRGRSRRGAS